MKKMAFVDLTNFVDWPVGGMLQYELSILPNLAKNFDIDLWGVSVDGRINKTLQINGNNYDIRIWANAKTRKKIIPNYWRGLKIIFKKKDFGDYDYVYVHTGSCAVALNMIINHKVTKLVYHQHGLSHLKDYSLMSLIQRPFINMAQKKADLVFVVSDIDSVNDYSKKMHDANGMKYIAVGSPIDLSLFENISEIKEKKREETVKLIYTGRIDSHKDVNTLIEVVKEYNSLNSNFEFEIVGDGGLRENVEKKIVEYGLKDKVHMMGALPRDKVLEELKKSHIYLTASIGEGVSISVLEAYAVGLPVICFEVPGLCKQVINGKTGIVVSQRDERMMANAIAEVASDLREYSINCLEEVKKYDVECICELIKKKIMDNADEI